MFKIKISPQDRAVFEKMVAFAKASPPNLDFRATLFDFVDDGPESYMRLYMSLLMVRFDTKDDNFRRNFGLSFIDVPYEDMLRHSIEGDGSVVMDGNLTVVDDHRYFNHVDGRTLAELKRLQSENYESNQPEPTGSGHNFLRFGSVYPGITTFVLSAERETVKTYKMGIQIPELLYRP